MKNLIGTCHFEALQWRIGWLSGQAISLWVKKEAQLAAEPFQALKNGAGMWDFFAVGNMACCFRQSLCNTFFVAGMDVRRMTDVKRNDLLHFLNSL